MRWTSWVGFAAGAALLAACTTPPPAAPSAAVSEAQAQPPVWSLVIHGGAGVITRSGMTPERDAQIRASLMRALEAGAAVLANGGASLDAVEAAVLVMEDDPQFNAGRGAVLTAAGTHELDAAVMDGRDRNTGAVAGVTTVKHPILAARAVMEKSEHVMFSGPGADAFAKTQGLEQVDNSYFTTPARAEALKRVLEERKRSSASDRHGTVGAAARDVQGNMSAGTSTGGMTAKAAGRVGDAPLIGAATYAENGVCATSSTGHGEYFIRVGVAKTLCDLVKLSGLTIAEAAGEALNQVAALGGDGGVIALGPGGEPAFVMNSEGMYRGYADATGVRWVAIYGDETR
ncbi:isoaspartyl peptidase/L-asparaginase [bacterium]|nr:isoaspartyl peptidase/L-asparaginase [bacterium]